MSATSRPLPAAPSAAAPPSNWALIGRMLGLGWQYRWACLRLLVLQGLLLLTAITTLRMVGTGIDLVRFHAGAPPSAAVNHVDSRREQDPGPLVDAVADRRAQVPAALPPMPLGLSLPVAWPAMAQIALVAGLVLACELVRGSLNYAYGLSSGSLIHTRIVPELRSRVYDKLQQLPFRFFDANPTGSIINRVTSDVQSVRAFIDGVLIQFVLLAVSFVCYLAFMLSIHPGLTAACLATTPLMWLVTVCFSRTVRPMYDRNRELVDRVILRLAESVQGVQVIKGFGRQPEEFRRFANDNGAVKDQQHGIFLRVSLFVPAIGWMTQINLVILLAYGGWLVTQDRLAVGSGLFVFAGLLQQFSSQVANLTNIANSVQQSLSGARRVFEILDTPVAIQSSPGAVKLSETASPRPLAGDARGLRWHTVHDGVGKAPDRTMRIEFQRVWFEYTPGNPVLKDVSFVVEPGERVAILGATGAGKSTLLALLCRFYDPTRGRILINGHDLRDLDLDDLRHGLGLVFQESLLFSNTVAANIAFGKPEATLDEVQAAAEVAAAAGFVENLPHGYDTVLGEGGLDLSGGQRQRLAIARAVLLDPAILLLDDPAAAIDAHTEHEILNSMERAMEGRTTLVVAHRLSTLRACDRVIVLEDGRIAQLGTHSELMAADGHYRDAAETQYAHAAA